MNKQQSTPSGIIRSTVVLLFDRFQSIEDIKLCERALALGVTHHRDGFPVVDRIRINRIIIANIDEELKRRAER